MEIEKKMKVERLEEVAEKLREAGAEYAGEAAQRDVYLDDEGRNLSGSDRGLRIRKEEKGGQQRVVVTYKGPREKAKYKRREEVEAEVGDAAAIERVLAEIGYRRMLVVEKRRQVWRMGGCEVCLDKVEGLGTYVEIEGPGDEAIEEVAERLGLAAAEHIGKGYAAMMRRKLAGEAQAVKD